MTNMDGWLQNEDKIKSNIHWPVHEEYRLNFCVSDIDNLEA